MDTHERVWEQPQAMKVWKPQGTYALLAAMGVMYILQTLVSASGSNGTYTRLFTINIDWPWRPWSLVTSTFSHGGLFHIFANGLMMYFFGPIVERLIGTKRMITLFLVAGAVSGVIQAHLAAAYGAYTVGGAWTGALIPNSNPLEYVYIVASGSEFRPIGALGALGASGAVMMLFGILMILIPKQKIMLLFPPIPLPLWVAGIAYAALDVLGAINPSSGIGNFAHLSGLAIGLGFGYWFKGDLARRGMKIHMGN